MRDNIRAAFDIDGILVESLDLILKGLEVRGFAPKLDNRSGFHFQFGKNKPPKDFLWDVFFYRLFTEKFDQMKPVDEYVIKVLEEIYFETGEPIRCITSRPKGALMHYATNATLELLFPEVEFSVEVVGSWKDKHRFMYSKDVFFEDRRKTCLNLADMGYIVFMRSTPYNPIANYPHLLHISEVEELGCRFGDIILYDDMSQIWESHEAMNTICPGIRS